MKFDSETFPSFTEFLKGTENYAESTAFRFRPSDFPAGNETVVSEYTRLIKAEDSNIMKDVEKATRVCEQESLRNVMMTTCKELDLWPPKTEDRLQSMAFTDMTEPLETIAWALFNYESNLEASSPEFKETRNKLYRTASYIVDFAHLAAGSHGGSKELSTSGSNLILAFLARVKEWTVANKQQDASMCIRKTIITRLNEFVDARSLKEIDQWFDDHWESVTVGGIAFLAGLAIAALAFKSKSRS